jgi:hypothetical protein
MYFGDKMTFRRKISPSSDSKPSNKTAEIDGKLKYFSSLELSPNCTTLQPCALNNQAYGKEVMIKICHLYCGMSDESRNSLIDSKVAIDREQLCGHVVSLATRKHTIIKETFSVPSVPGLRNED